MADGAHVVRIAESQLGKPYEEHRDCSGFTQWVYAQVGIKIPSGSVAQFSYGRVATEPRAGDLMFWDTFDDAPGHVGIADGKGGVIHAMNEHMGITRTTDALSKNMGGRNRYMGARRLIMQEPDEDDPRPKGRGAHAGAGLPVVEVKRLVTAATPFRETGNTTREAFRQALSRTIGKVTSPMAEEADAIYDALAPAGLTRLGAAMAWIERRNETDPGGLAYYPRSYHNAWAVKVRGDWGQWDTYENAARFWGAYVLGKTYEHLTTLDQFIRKYAPDFENDTNRYIKMLVDEINALPLHKEEKPAEPKPTTPAPIPWSPTIYDLRNNTHAQMFGLTNWERDQILGKRIENRGGAVPQIIGLHVQWGNSKGSLRHWLGVSASSTIMVQKDGSILKIIPEEHGPWTQGDVNGPDRSMSRAIQRWGADPNVYSLTIEAEDERSLVINEAQFKTIVWQIRKWYEKWPHLYDEDWLDRLFGHYQINSRDRPDCGKYVGDVEKAIASNAPAPAPEPGFVGLPSWLPGDFFKAVFPLADPKGAVTAKLIEWIGANGQVPFFKEKIDVGSGRNIWVFDSVTLLSDKADVWMEGEDRGSV